MTDTTTPLAGAADAAPAESSALSLSQAVQMLAERRAQREGAERASQAASTSDPANDNADSETVANDGQSQACENTDAEPSPQHEPSDSEPQDEIAATIEIDGVTLTADDVRRGYMRQADYSRKTQKLAEASRSVEAERTVKLARLDQLIEALNPESLREPDWVQVARADPHNWVQRKIQWENRRVALESAKRVSDAVHADTLERDRKIMVEELAGNYNPAWADANVRTREFRDLARYAMALGFSAEDVAGIAHAREMIVLDKARRWDALQYGKASMAKRLSQVPNVQRPGARTTVASHQRSLGNAWERFLKNPTVENGAAYQRAKREASRFRRNSET